jgi:predicted nuclease of predicted toxin-antitoxin system
VFVADENIESAIVGRLREDGHDVVWIAEYEPGTTDDRVLAIAEEQQRLLITGDADFGEIVFRQGRSAAGVVLLRLTGLTPDRKAAIVSEVLAKYLVDMQGAFSVVAPAQVRIRKNRP